MFNSPLIAELALHNFDTQLDRAIEAQGEQPILKELKAFLDRVHDAMLKRNPAQFKITLSQRSFCISLTWPAIPQLSRLAQEEYLQGTFTNSIEEMHYLFSHRSKIVGVFQTVTLDHELHETH